MTRGNIILCVGGAALLLAIALGFGWLWSLSGTRDSRTSPDGLVARLMKLKSAAVRDIRDGLEQGDLGARNAVSRNCAGSVRLPTGTFPTRATVSLATSFGRHWIS